LVFFVVFVFFHEFVHSIGCKGMSGITPVRTLCENEEWCLKHKSHTMKKPKFQIE
jgi:hypothetical protein